MRPCDAGRQLSLAGGSVPVLSGTARVHGGAVHCIPLSFTDSAARVHGAGTGIDRRAKASGRR
jgi:hypothetical protein